MKKKQCWNSCGRANTYRKMHRWDFYAEEMKRKIGGDKNDHKIL